MIIRKCDRCDKDISVSFSARMTERPNPVYKDMCVDCLREWDEFVALALFDFLSHRMDKTSCPSHFMSIIVGGMQAERSGAN